MSAEHNLSAVVIVPASLAALLGQTQGRGFLLEEVDAQVAQRGHDRRGVAFADAAGVFVEDHVQAPVEPVFNAPVPAHRMGEAFGVGRDGIDEVTPLYGLCIPVVTGPLHHPDAAQPGPALGVG